MGPVTAIDAGQDLMLALLADGTAWGWGDNHLGQLADGTNIDRPTPIQVPGLTNLVAVSAQQFYTVALTSGGRTIKLFGHAVPNLGGITQVAQGGTHQLFLVAPAGQVYASGRNSSGEVGLEETYDLLHIAPLAVPWAAHAGAGVNVAFGSFHLQQDDLAVPGRGAGLALARTYNSSDLTDQGSALAGPSATGSRSVTSGRLPLRARWCARATGGTTAIHATPTARTRRRRASTTGSPSGRTSSRA